MTSLIESFRLATSLRLWTLALFLSCPPWGLADHPSVSKPLVIGSELDFPPFALVREGGAPDGFTVELWRAVASAAHLDGTIKTGPFHEILEQFKNGQVDVLINLAISDQRRGFADFSLRHVKMSGAVFTRKGDDRIKSEADLAGKSLIAVKADLAHDYANRRGWYNLALVDTVAEGMKLLAGSSRHDAMLVGRLVGLNTTKDLRLAGVQALPLKLGFQQDFAFAVRKGNAQLLARINDGLANVHASGAYETIYAKWFAGLEPQPLSMETLLNYLVPAIAAILLLALAYCRERGLRLRWKQSASSLQLSIAEREQAELDLRASEARFTAFMDHSPAIAFIKDGGGRYVYVNKTWENIYALDWRGKTDVELWPRDDAEMFSESDRRALEAGQASESFETVLDKDGRPQDWWVMKFPIVDAAGKRLLGGVALDVTERKRVEIALRESEARLRTIIDTEPECVKVVAPDGRLVDMNAAGLSMLQADSLADLADKSLIDFVQPDYRPAFNDLHRKVMGGESGTLEFEITGLRGRQRWLETHAAPLRDAGGEVTALLGVTQDITDRKAAETDRARLAAIVENSGDAIISRDLDFRVLTWNRAAERMFGYGAEEVIGIKTDDLFIPADRLAEVAEKRELMSRDEPVPPYDTVRLGRNGRAVDVSITQSPIRDASGRVTGVSLTIRDISERKRSEEALRAAHEDLEQRVYERTAELSRINHLLRASEERLQHALTVGKMGTWERDLATGGEEWDQRTYEIFGIAPGTVVDLETFISRIHPDDLCAVREAVQLTERTGAAYDCDYRVIKPDGKLVWIHATGGLRRDASGQPSHLAGINFDITERKQAEDALRRLTEDLDRRVAERTRELAESQGRLRALVAEITKAEERERRRLAVELHDYLAQMLTVSRFNISRAGKLAVDAELKKRLADAQQSVDDSIAYTRSLMAQLSPRVLYELGLPAALNWLAAEMLERHGLSVEVAGESDGVRLDEERSVLAFQCVRELVWNIVKHAQTNSASLSYEIQRGGLSIEIADEGQGFDAETLHGGGVEKFGLFSVRERLELLGGRLAVTSRPGGGTIVRFNVPARPIEIASAITESALPPLATMAKEKRVSVALVDDHEVVRRGLRQVLEECADLTVVGEASDGLEGVELAREFCPDVVVMDVNMPRMNGIEATRLITQEMPSTIVVGLSFDSGEQVRQAMKASGASTCVTKERAVEDIHQAIIDAVEERRSSIMENG
jgi:PAS domain S-box-containing protein